VTRKTVEAGFDTWAESAHPAASHGDDKTLHVGANANAYIHTAAPVPPGWTVLSATLSVYIKGGFSGPTTLTLKRLTDSWKARTLNWNNRPGVVNSDAISQTVGSKADRDWIDFDVTTWLQAIASGTAKNYGWWLNAPVDMKFYSAQAGIRNPRLTVEYVEGPGAPTSLRPAGGIVSVSKPTLSWDYVGADDLASFQVQIDPNANGTFPAFTSGIVTATDPIYPLATSSYAGLANAAATNWRVRVTDTAGQTSDWSDWVEMTRDDKGTLTLNNPAASPNNVVTEPTPPILFALAGETMKSFRVFITDTATNKIILDSGRISSSTGEYRIPKRPKTKKPYLKSGKTYNVKVRVHDGKVRQGSLATGDEPWTQLSRDFTVSFSNTVAAPTMTSVTQYLDTPAASVNFTRSTAPDRFVILRDGVEIDTDVDPVDVVVSGTNYRYIDWTAIPHVAHQYQVRAVVNGTQSASSAQGSLAGGIDATSVWIIDPDTARYFSLAGDDVSSWVFADVGTDYQPIGAQRDFRITQALAGLSGKFDGLLEPTAGRTITSLAADVFAIKEDAPHTETYRLVADYLNIPVRLSNITCSVSENSTLYNPQRRVSFVFSQTDEFDFESRV